MNTRTELATICGWEISENVLSTSRQTGRALVRLQLLFGGSLTADEETKINTLPPDVAAKVKAVVLSKKSVPYWDIFALADLEAYGMPAQVAPADAAGRETWNYTAAVTPMLNALVAAKTPYLGTVVGESIFALLKGTPYGVGVDADGQVVPITGVTRVDDGSVSTTRYRILPGIPDDDAKKSALQKMYNGILVDVGNGILELGATADERAAYARKFEQ